MYSVVPPWSIATSTITPPSGISLTISFVTNLGAFAPGINTVLTTKSAVLIALAILNLLE